MAHFLFSLLLSVTVHAAPALNTTCGSAPASAPFTYCLTETEGSTSNNIIYFLHGGRYEPMTESNWANSEGFAELRGEWERAGKPAPRVVEISYGPIWLLTPRNAGPRSGLLEAFVNEAIPFTDAKLTNPTVGKRALLGHSMGGLNTALLATFKPGVFSRAAMLAPAFFGISPYASESKIRAYAERQGFDMKSFANLVEMAKAFVPNDKTWNTLSPDTCAKTLAAQKLPLYISSGTEDRLFYAPNKKFAELVKKRGGKMIWKSLSGENHGDLEAESLAEFLVPANEISN